MAFLSIKEHTGDGVTTDFLFDIPYIKEADVHGYVNDVENSITFVDPTTVRFASAPADGTAIQIKRLTDVLALRHEFPNPTYLKTGNVENDFDQQLFLHQEEDDETTRLDARIDDAVVAGGVRVQDESIAEFVGTTLNFIGQGVTVTETPANTARVEISDTSAIKENTDFDYLYGGEGSLATLDNPNKVTNSVFLGTDTGNVLNASSSRNVVIGKDAMLYVDGATNDCVLIGYQTGTGHPTFGAGGLGEYTIGVGTGAAQHCKGVENIAIGHNAGTGSNSGWAGSHNVMIGEQALNGSSGSASRNVALGPRTLKLLTDGTDNVGVGYFAGTNLGAASADNTLLGADTFQGVTLATGNVALGHNAGPATGATHTDKLFIDNTRRDDPLIAGDFNARTITFNGVVTFASAPSIPTSDTTDALNTTGAAVDVAAAAPPTIGQRLTATSATTAVWETPAGGGYFDVHGLGVDNTVGGTNCAANFVTGNFNFWGGEDTVSLNMTNSNRSTVIGSQAGLNINTVLDDVTAIGAYAMSQSGGGGAGKNAGIKCVAIGSYAGSNMKGDNCVAVGHNSCKSNTSGSTGDFNTWVGADAGLNAQQTVHDNTAIGYKAFGGASGFYGASHYNVALGSNAGNGVTSPATGNVLLGYSTGTGMFSGDYNICIGYLAGPTATHSNGLFIDKSQRNDPLIGGDFGTPRTITINGHFNVTQEFHYTATVDNVAAVALDWTNGNIQTIAPTAALNPTYTTTDPTGPTKIFLKATNLGAAGTVTWPATFKWPAGTEPTWTAAGVDIMEFLFDGTDYHLVGYSLASA